MSVDTSRRSSWMAVAGLLAVFGAADAWASERVLGSVARTTNVDVFAETVVWSDYRRGEGYRLVAFRDGRVRTLDVPPRRAPFDADLGPDRRGRTVVVFSRCRQESPSEAAPRGCRLYRYDLASRRVRRIRAVGRRGYSDEWPSIWRGRIAFARHRDPSRRESPVLDRFLVREPGGALRRLRRGSMTDYLDGTVNAMDLRGRRLAFGWSYTPDGCVELGDDAKGIDPPGAYEVWLVRLGEGRRRLATGCSDDGTAVGSPSLTPQGSEFVAYARTGIERVLLDRGGEERARTPVPPVHDVSSDGTQVASVEEAERGYRVILRDAGDDSAPPAQASMRTPLRSVPTPPTSISTTSPSRR